MTKKPKIVLFDIETFPIISYNWGIYDQTAIKVIKDWELACFSYKELGDKKTYCIKRSDFKDPTDKSVAKELYKVMNEADILIAHNGDSFDIKKAKARFIHHGFKPLAPIKSIDTKKLAKNHFNFTSNKLNDLGEFLGVGNKVPTGGFDLWLECLANDPKAWNKMEDYNIQDVLLLEKVYLKLRSWATHPNLAMISGQHGQCPRCGDTRLRSCGYVVTNTTKYLKLRCQGCWGYIRVRKSEKEKSKLINIA